MKIAQRAWDIAVYGPAGRRVIDTVFFDADMRASEVKRALIRSGEAPDGEFLVQKQKHRKGIAA